MTAVPARRHEGLYFAIRNGKLLAGLVVLAALRWRPWRSYAVMHLWALAVPTLFTRPTPPTALPRSA